MAQLTHRERKSLVDKLNYMTAAELETALGALIRSEEEWVSAGLSDGFFASSLAGELLDSPAAMQNASLRCVLENCRNSLSGQKAAAEKNRYPAYYQLGGPICFGRYPKDGSGELQPIEWVVLAADDRQALLHAKHGIDCRQFHEKWEAVTWETSDLRAWLNGGFYESGFSEEEKKRLLLTQNQNAGNIKFHVSGGGDTQDKVFLLSVEEVQRYYAGRDLRRKTATAYAKAHNCWSDEADESCGYWLRTPGNNDHNVSYVSNLGIIHEPGDLALMDINAVVPAVVVNLRKETY